MRPAPLHGLVSLLAVGCAPDPSPAAVLAKLDAVAREVPMRTADPATAHMYVVAPLQEMAGSIVELFSTHPRVEERIRRLRAMQRGAA